MDRQAACRGTPLAPRQLALTPQRNRNALRAMENAMTDHVYKQIELVGSSTTSSDEAIRRAIERASGTLRNVEWFEVTSTRGHIENGKVAHWQVCLKIGVRIEEPGD